MKNEAHTQQDMVAALHNCINIQHHTIDENGHALLDEKQQMCTTLVKPKKKHCLSFFSFKEAGDRWGGGGGGLVHT